MEAVRNQEGGTAPHPGGFWGLFAEFPLEEVAKLCSCAVIEASSSSPGPARVLVILSPPRPVPVALSVLLVPQTALCGDGVHSRSPPCQLLEPGRGRAFKITSQSFPTSLEQGEQQSCVHEQRILSPRCSPLPSLLHSWRPRGEQRAWRWEMRARTAPTDRVEP